MCRLNKFVPTGNSLVIFFFEKLLIYASYNFWKTYTYAIRMLIYTEKFTTSNFDVKYFMATKPTSNSFHVRRNRLKMAEAVFHIFTFSSHTEYIKRESIVWVKKKFPPFDECSWFVCLRRQNEQKKISVCLYGCTYVRGLFMWTQ